jgi:hypothetical protein
MPPLRALISLRPSTLRDLISESLIFGWHLRRVEEGLEAEHPGLLTLQS